jgi:DNA-binding transcriptional MerR regulator
MNFRPADVAKQCGVSVNTIRQWCEDYGEFLSPGAKVKDTPRILTERDLQVLERVSELRKEKLQRPQIVLRLRETKFGTVEPAPSELQPSVALQESPQQAIVPIAVVEALERIQARQERIDGRIDTLEAQRPTWRDVFLFVLSAFIAGLIVGLAVWWFQ